MRVALLYNLAENAPQPNPYAPHDILYELDHPKNIEAYEKALALNPKNVNVIVDQGTCYRGIGKFDKAVELYRKAIKIDPSFPNAHRNLGVVLAYDLHDAKQALPEFRRYLELVPDAKDADAIKQTIRDLSSAK